MNSHLFIEIVTKNISFNFCGRGICVEMRSSRLSRWWSWLNIWWISSSFWRILIADVAISWTTIRHMMWSRNIVVLFDALQRTQKGQKRDFKDGILSWTHRSIIFRPKNRRRCILRIRRLIFFALVIVTFVIFQRELWRPVSIVIAWHFRKALCVRENNWIIFNWTIGRSKISIDASQVLLIWLNPFFVISEHTFRVSWTRMATSWRFRCILSLENV